MVFSTLIRTRIMQDVNALLHDDGVNNVMSAAPRDHNEEKNHESSLFVSYKRSL